MSAGRIACIVLCFIALSARLLQTYRRAGNPVYTAEIIGFYETSDAWKKSANYKVKYVFQDQEVEAITLESVPGHRYNKKEEYLHKKIEVFVNEKDLGMVSIRGDHSIDFACGILLLFGIIGILLN